MTESGDADSVREIYKALMRSFWKVGGQISLEEKWEKGKNFRRI